MAMSVRATPSSLPSLLGAAALLRGAAEAFAPPLWRPVPGRRRTRPVHRETLPPCRSKEILDDDGDDWRAFRARLVRSGLPTPDDGLDDRPTSTNNASKNGGYAHETTPLVEVGSLLASVPTRDLCQALEQQYWHRSVVLVTEVSANVVRGEEEVDVPTEELAMGERRGRWSHRGLLLNRCTDRKLLDDGTTIGTADSVEGSDEIASANNGTNNGWRIQRGGDLLGLDSESGTEYVCLHHLGTSDPRVREVSTKIMGSLCRMALSDAQALCREHPDEYRPSDFLTFAGFCAWRPGQLEREMGPERREWRAMSVDEGSVWDVLQKQWDRLEAIIEHANESGNVVAKELLGLGTDVWRSVLGRIDVSETQATERLPPGQLQFYDRMLQVWAEENLIVDKSRHIQCTTPEDDSDQIRPGTIVRATSPPTNDMLLYDAEFVRSIVLVLEETPDATVGILLHHPMAAAVECREGEAPLPLRYGGPVDVPSWRDGSYCYDDNDGAEGEEDEVYEGFLDYQSDGIAFEDVAFDDISGSFGSDDDDDSSFVWIHRDGRLGLRVRNGGGGARLGDSDLWLIGEDDALAALQSGTLRSQDVMVFAGVCIWEKGPALGMCGGGLREQVDALGALEVARPNEDIMQHAWDALAQRQEILSQDSLDGNIDAAIEAWEALSGGPTKSSREEGSRTRLADAALKAWIGTNLLEDPLATLVEVRDDQRRELFG